ncbi:MAG: hypothetical protein ACLFWL_10340 [Candidatus Brocadiia bacterium]
MMARPKIFVATILLVLVVCCPLAIPAGEKGAKKVLRLEKYSFSILNARRWDQTRQEWQKKPEELFFDAVHRFLLLRFPGCADQVKAICAQGYRVESARLWLRWQRQEFRRVADYNWRGYAVKNKKLPQWHARAWLLNRCWQDDAKKGPTWNAWKKGSGYWRQGGARAAGVDRSAQPLSTVLLSEKSPDGEFDVSEILSSSRFGADLAARLARLEQCGFLIAKKELKNYEIGQKGSCTGVARIWVTDPVLTITFKRSSDAPDIAALPEGFAERAFAQSKGLPSAQVPRNLDQLTRHATARPREMPEWMWKRVREVRDLHTPRHPPAQYSPPEWVILNQLESGNPETYMKAVRTMLRMPPGWFMGHQHINFMLPLLKSPRLLPGALRYHIKKFFEARWTPPYNPKLFQHRVGYFNNMGTLNHQSQARSEAILAGEMLGLQDVTHRGQRGLSLMNRQMIWLDGACQEHGDTFYRGITLTPLQTVARYSPDPLTSLKAELAVEKLLLADICTYHPALRRRVSSVSRRYRVDDLLLGQDVPRAALHMLSRDGVLLHTDTLKVQGIPSIAFNSLPPSWAAAVAPWGREWESHAIDDKPLPFTFIATSLVRGWLKEPIYHVTHLGPSYGLSSMTGNKPVEWPVVAAWSRNEGRAEKFDNLSVMFPWAHMNDLPICWIGQHKQAGKPVNPLLSVLQSGRRMIYVMRPPERLFLEPTVRSKKVRSLSSRWRIYAYGDTADREIYAGGRAVTEFPAAASAGGPIALRDGVTYLGFIPLPATDLGRKREIYLTFDRAVLSIRSYLLDADEPLQNDEETWQRLANATAGWYVEFGCEEEDGSFEKFRRRLREVQIATRWDEKSRTLHVSAKGEEVAMEMGCRTDVEREKKMQYLSPSATASYMRVNGESPWPAAGIDLDCPLAQMGKATRLEKGGAVLETAEGQPALLRVEPVSGIYEAVNPLVDPTPFRLTVPGGIEILSEGSLGCGRITVQPSENTLWIDYRLPPPGGDAGAELLQVGARAGEHAGVYKVEPYLKKFFREGIEVTHARETSARHLLVQTEGERPRVFVNGRQLEGVLARIEVDGEFWYRVPIAEGQ